MSHAHNYVDRSLPIYRFLGSLQGQGMAQWVTWGWGPAVSAPFLPRVVCGKVVLSRARWRVSPEELNPLHEARGFERFNEVQRWRRERRLPRFVLLAEADNQLLVDFDTALSVDMFVELARRRSSVVLVELLPGPDELLASGPEGGFVHELVVPFVSDAPPRTETVDAPSATVSAPPGPRTFVAGSAWLYAKLYCGEGTADRVLERVMRPVLSDPTIARTLDRWFFLRFHDPDPHLRLRFHGDPRDMSSVLLDRLHRETDGLLAEGLVRRLQIDTYEREVERYGGHLGILEAERVFHIDSEAALELIARLRGAPPELRWQWTLCGIDRLMDDAGLDLAGRLRVIEEMRDSFGREFRVDKPLRIELGHRYRKHRGHLEQLLDRRVADASWSVWDRRSARLRPVIAELHGLERAGRLTRDVETLLPSLVHMHVNRMIRSDQRRHELVLYDFLQRTYASRAARDA